MYADRSSGRKRSVRDRLGSGGGSRSRSDDAKRFRRDDGTWRRELYKDSGGTQTSSGTTSRNLQSNKKSFPDLREKLSGIPSQRPQFISTVQVPKPAREIINSDKPKVSAPAPVPALPAPQQPQEKVDASLESLLKSLDLEKYLINFQAEEACFDLYVDMKALAYMNEEDMKSLGIPMGPRKKILSALVHKKRKSSKSLPTS
ncbi:hypothetical protein PVAP13_6NG319550 [Panicum virgatum]|uniref:SAM domain-containing protein n=1 Tax=Panicum virgatum TaxID=38727 RepID=A0A8T0R3J8_PANVG|nr:hypothetical protein PVAP13_6NG319550 [Panicum virgatum]